MSQACRGADQWLSALTARRGRGAEEKAPGKEQSGGSPMPEQEEGADGVPAAGERAAGRGGERACARVGQVIKAVVSVRTGICPGNLDPSALPCPPFNPPS